MGSKQSISSVLANFLGTYTSRYSDYRGYWLFGFLHNDLDNLNIDLLTLRDSELNSPLSAAIELSAVKFADQLSKAEMARSSVREASLTTHRLPGSANAPVNGKTCGGHYFNFCARAVMDNGRRYQNDMIVFIAPHNPAIESRSSRADE